MERCTLAKLPGQAAPLQCRVRLRGHLSTPLWSRSHWLRRNCNHKIHKAEEAQAFGLDKDVQDHQTPVTPRLPPSHKADVK